MREDEGACCVECGSTWVKWTRWGDVACRDCGAISKRDQAEERLLRKATGEEE